MLTDRILAIVVAGEKNEYMNPSIAAPLSTKTVIMRIELSLVEIEKL
jgi:hypothetical protein